VTLNESAIFSAVGLPELGYVLCKPADGFNQNCDQKLDQTAGKAHFLISRSPELDQQNAQSVYPTGIKPQLSQ
jgi:hypothetical protein